MDREAITAEIFSRLMGISGLRTISRKPKDFSSVPTGELPAVFLGIGSSESRREQGKPPLWTLRWTVYVYCYDSSSAGPSSELNGYISSVESTLVPTQDERNAAHGQSYATTLGGLVHRAWVTDVTTDEGSLGDLAVAILTIEALATG